MENELYCFRGGESAPFLFSEIFFEKAGMNLREAFLYNWDKYQFVSFAQPAWLPIIFYEAKNAHRMEQGRLKDWPK